VVGAVPTGTLSLVALSEADRIKMLEALAADESLKATQRLRALEELGRIESRRAGGNAAAPDSPDEVFADPMADLDEMEAARQKRQRRRAS
jgi:hypothetical protein